jgi:hypothetical protein
VSTDPCEALIKLGRCAGTCTAEILEDSFRIAGFFPQDAGGLRNSLGVLLLETGRLNMPASGGSWEYPCTALRVGKPHFRDGMYVRCGRNATPRIIGFAEMDLELAGNFAWHCVGLSGTAARTPALTRRGLRLSLAALYGQE